MIEPDFVEELNLPRCPGLLFLFDLLEHRALLRPDHPKHPDLPEDQAAESSPRRHHLKVHTQLLFTTLQPLQKILLLITKVEIRSCT